MFYPHPRHQLNLCEPGWKWLPESSKTRYEVVMWGRFYFLKGNIYHILCFIGCNSADAWLTQAFRTLLCSPPLHRKPRATVCPLNNKAFVCQRNTDQHFSALEPFLIGDYIFNLRQWGYGDWLQIPGRKKEPINFSWTQKTSQYFLSHLQVEKMSLMMRHYLENLCELIKLI